MEKFAKPDWKKVEDNTQENQLNPVAEPAVDPSQKEPQQKEKSFLRDLFETILLAVVLFLILNTVTSRVKVYNISMEPTLKQGYLLLVNKMAYKIGEPKRGDVIVFHFQGDQAEDYIKRVVGLPGDQVDIANGIVRVNNQPLTEPYIMDLPNYTGSWVVPEDELFVLGDNRNHSSDSHQWGTVKLDWVVGKALLVYWPLNAVDLLSVSNIVSASP